MSDRTYCHPDCRGSWWDGYLWHVGGVIETPAERPIWHCPHCCRPLLPGGEVGLSDCEVLQEALANTTLGTPFLEADSRSCVTLYVGGYRDPRTIAKASTLTALVAKLREQP